MLFVANEIVNLSGGLHEAIVWLLSLSMLCGVLLCPTALLPTANWVRWLTVLPVLAGIVGTLRDWRYLRETCYYLQQQDAISPEQLEMFWSGSFWSMSWLMTLGIFGSLLVRFAINWRMQRKIHQTSSSHPAKHA